MAEVWLIDDASGPVQLHRSAMVTVLAASAAPAGAAEHHGNAQGTCDGKRTPPPTPPSSASRVRARALPPGPSAPVQAAHRSAVLLMSPVGSRLGTVPDYIDHFADPLGVPAGLHGIRCLSQPKSQDPRVGGRTAAGCRTPPLREASGAVVATIDYEYVLLGR